MYREREIHVYTRRCIHISLSLSLSIYIYIYIYVLACYIIIMILLLVAERCLKTISRVPDPQAYTGGRPGGAPL